MKVPSKNVVMGILFSFALLPILSCAIAGPGEYGSIAIGISIPKSIGNTSLPSALREAFAPSASSRFIHPGTRRIEVVVALNGGREQIRADASVAEGEESVSITVGKVPYGNHELTVSLYGPEGVLLSRGTTAVSVEGRAAASANVTAVPVTELTFRPGPFGREYGTVIPAADYGTLCVYRVSIPNAGAYGLLCNDSGIRFSLKPDQMALYDANGQRIAFNSADTYVSYSWIPAGDCYVVVNAPSRVSGELRLSLDADLRVAMKASTLSIRPGLVVQDKSRHFSILIPCGFTGTYTILFGSAQGRGCAFSSPSPGEIGVEPGVDGLLSCIQADTGASITFTDALLGISRKSIPFSFAGAPRTFVYDADIKPNDSAAVSALQFNDIIEKAVSVGGVAQAIAALQDGEVYNAVKPFSLSTGVFLLGGFASGGTLHAQGSSTVSFATAENAINISSDDTIIENLVVHFPGGRIVASGAPIIVNSTASFKNCRIEYLADVLFSDLPYTYSVVLSSRTCGTLTLDSSAILGPRFSLSNENRTPISLKMSALTSENGYGTLAISNSVLHLGTLSSVSGNISSMTLHGIDVPNASYATIAVAGSIISSGFLMGTPSPTPYMRAIYMYGSTGNSLIVANSLLLMGDFTNSSNAFLYSSGAIESHLNNLILGYSNILDSSAIINFGPTATVNFKECNGSLYGRNPILQLTSLSLASTDATRADFLKPQASSPTSLLSGGADLSVESIRSNTYVSGFPPEDLAHDHLGVPRTGNGTTGYSIGAFEFD